jgi:hypothetical protein
VIHLGHFLALAGLGGACAAEEVGLRGGARRRAVFRLQEQPTVYNIQRKRDRRGRWCSPRARIGRRSSAGGSTSMAGGGDEVALLERIAAGVLRAPGLHGSARGVPAEVILGSRRLGNHRR